MAVDEQDGTDLRWVKIDLYRDLYEYNPPELFGVLASLRIASVSNDKSTLVNICAYKNKNDDKICVFSISYILDLRIGELLRNREYITPALQIARLLQKATSITKSYDSTLEIFKETPCITEKSFLSFISDASEKIDLDDDIAVMTLVSVIFNKISYRSFSELNQDIESVRDLIDDSVIPSFSYCVESMLSIIYVLVCDNKNNKIHPTDSLMIMNNVICFCPYRNGCILPSYRLRQIPSVAGYVDNDLWFVLELLDTSRSLEDYIPGFVPFGVVVKVSDRLMSLDLVQGEGTLSNSSSVLSGHTDSIPYNLKYNLAAIFMILVEYLDYLATANRIHVKSDRFSNYRDLMSDGNGVIKACYIPVEMLLKTIEILDVVDPSEQMSRNFIGRILRKVRNNDGSTFSRIGLNNGDRIFDDLKLSMYTCISMRFTEGSLTEMSQIVETFISVIMDHMCISTKRADGKESYLDNFNMMPMVFAFLSGCVMNKIYESGVKELTGFDLPALESMVCK